MSMVKKQHSLHSRQHHPQMAPADKRTHSFKAQEPPAPLPPEKAKVYQTTRT